MIMFSLEWRNKKNQKLDCRGGVDGWPVVVDFVPENILGDAILCVYYFFVTVLPWHRGPRVFRDWLVLSCLLWVIIVTEAYRTGAAMSELEESVSFSQSTPTSS